VPHRLHIQEEQWAEKSQVQLPYTPRYENAGWVHEIGSGVTNVEVGDTVIVHRFITCGLCRPWRRGDDMHRVTGSSPGINRDGGLAEFLFISARSVVRARPVAAPASIPALADAGPTAIHTVMKTIRRSAPGTRAVVIGPAASAISASSAWRRWRRPRSSSSTRTRRRSLSRPSSAPTTRSRSRASATSRPCELTDGHGAEAIIDFVGENGAVEDGVAMIRDGGFYYVIGYLQNIHSPSSRKYSKANNWAARRDHARIHA